MLRVLTIVGVIVAFASVTASASAAYCSSNNDTILYAGANTSCQLASNAANHAITYYNRMVDWPSRTSGFSSVSHKWYRFSLVGYYADSVKYRGRGRDGAVAFTLKFQAE